MTLANNTRSEYLIIEKNVFKILRVQDGVGVYLLFMLRGTNNEKLLPKLSMIYITFELIPG